MVGSTGTLMTMRLVRSKLRKREETSAVSPPGHHVEAQLNHYNNNNSNNHQLQHHQQQQQSSQQTNPDFNGTSNGQQQNGLTPVGFRQNPQSVWVFPPLPPQPNIFCINNHDALAHLNEKSGFKGFRKQFSGRFKRFVAKKSHEPTSVIPPELKPQLKTIYVY